MYINIYLRPKINFAKKVRIINNNNNNKDPLLKYANTIDHCYFVFFRRIKTRRLS